MKPRAVVAAAALVALGVAAAMIVRDALDEPSPTDDDASGWHAVDRVVDGDTIVLEGGMKVRLVQTDAPEVAGPPECFGAEARDAARLLLPRGAEVRLERDLRLDDADRFGRLLRYVVRRDGVNVNLRQVADGAAAPYFYRGTRGAHAGELERSAAVARAAGAGLWGACPGTPLAPTRSVDTGPG